MDFSVRGSMVDRSIVWYRPTFTVRVSVSLSIIIDHDRVGPHVHILRTGNVIWQKQKKPPSKRKYYGSP